MELSGKIIFVLEKRSGVAKSTGNPWSVQSYVLETHDQYPRRMCFEVFGEDKINQFAIKAGEEVVVSFDIDAHEYQDRWYNSIRAWKVDRLAQAVAAVPVAAVPGAAVPVDVASGNADSPQSTETLIQPAGSADDLPF